LRKALDAVGARVIVFDVGGHIELLSDLVLHEPYSRWPDRRRPLLASASGVHRCAFAPMTS
jgi:hypothetical protein